MPTYAFKGRNRLNELVTGERDAASQDELRALLRREQIVMTQASEKGREFAVPKLGRRKKVKAKELAVFTRQFSVMIDAETMLRFNLTTFSINVARRCSIRSSTPPVSPASTMCV